MYTKIVTKDNVHAIAEDLKTYFDFQKAWNEDTGEKHYYRPEVIIDEEREKLVIATFFERQVVIPYGAEFNARDCLKTLKEKMQKESFAPFYYGDTYLNGDPLFTFTWVEDGGSIKVIGGLTGVYLLVGECMAFVA